MFFSSKFFNLTFTGLTLLYTILFPKLMMGLELSPLRLSTKTASISLYFYKYYKSEQITL